MSHTLAMGGLGALGIIGMPLMIAAMLLKQPPGPVAKLIAAKATSPETPTMRRTMSVRSPSIGMNSCTSATPSTLSHRVTRVKVSPS